MAQRKKRLTKDQKKLAELERDLAREICEKDTYRTLSQKSETARMKAEDSEKDARAQFGELKQRLLHAETELAKLRGVVARVDREDAMRERAALIAAGKPPAPERMLDVGEELPQGIARYHDHQEVRRHWTSY